MSIKKFDEFDKSEGSKEIEERAIDVSQFPDTYLNKRKDYDKVFTDIVKMIKDMSWKEITFENVGGRRTNGETYEYPILPASIREKIKEAYRLDNARAKLLTQSGHTFAKTFRGDNLDSSDTIHMKVESVGSMQRSHFPGNGIPDALKGTGLGYKLYRALLEKYEYLRSNKSGTDEKDRVWYSIISPKKDASGNLTDDDVHGIIASTLSNSSDGHVLAIIKTIPDSKKIDIATKFLHNPSFVNLDNITARNFAIDPELLSILPESVQDELDPVKRESIALKKKIEAEKAAKAEAERVKAEAARIAAEAARTMPERLAKFAPEGLDADWGLGDYIVVKQYLLQPNFALPVRKVVAKEGQNWIALKIEDLAAYYGHGRQTDVRRTDTKSEWVKSQLQPGQVDPVKRATPAATTSPTPAAPRTTGIDLTSEISAWSKKDIARFISARGAQVRFYVNPIDWDRRNRTNILTGYYVKETSTGFAIMDSRTGTVINKTREEFDAMELQELTRTKLTNKSDVSPGDWVLLREHKKYIGCLVKVKYITPISALHHAVYVNVPGHGRALMVTSPGTLDKLTPFNLPI